MIFNKNIWITVALLLGTSATGLYGQGSVLNSGNWHKMAVLKEGVHKINYALLKKMGIDPSKIDPRKIKIYGNVGGMLPQRNSASRPSDLTENAIMVSGEADGRFDKNDFILFFASGPDAVSFDVQRNIYRYERNLYSNENYYFLTVASDNGKRILTSENLATSATQITDYDDYYFHEIDENKVDPYSGREWYGERFNIGVNATNELELNLPISNIAPSSTIKMVSDVLGQTYTSGSFRILFNGTNVKEQPILTIPVARYAIKGAHTRDTISIQSAAVGAEGRSSQTLRYEFQRGTGYSQGYLDFFLLSFQRQLALYDDQTIFLSRKSLDNLTSTFKVAGVSAQSMIWDVTDIYNARSQDFSVSGSEASFTTPTTSLKRFVAFNPGVDAPLFVAKVANQDLRGLSTPNLVIVTHPDFLSEAERLAQHRESFSNMTVHVVTTHQVYNEFSGGRQDVSAIRDFLKFLRDKNASALKSVLLFGKGSYDYKDRIFGNTNFVITYESRNSLHPLETYSSDDYFTFLENNEGDWIEGRQPQQHTMDIGVGRLPATTPDEARAMVNKIIDYDVNKKSLGYWRKQIAFVADDGNSDDGFSERHQEDANLLAEFVEESGAGVDTRKLFMGSYVKTLLPNREVIPDLMDDIVRAFDRGSVIINFTGHGSERQWTDENVFNKTIISELDNKTFPFLVTATCEFGRHDDPTEISGAESSIKLEGGGAIGLVTTARPVSATSNFFLNMAFYDNLFTLENNSYRTIGEVFRRTKNNSMSGVSNRNFSLLADPSMTLALPENEVVITEMKTQSGSDTLKALSTVTAKGEIRNRNNVKLTSFNGILEATLFDKEVHTQTIGRNNPPFEYELWSNSLFRGKATVKDGEFELTFMIPKNIDYSVAGGRFSLYASDPETYQDASGIYENIKVGRSESTAASDNVAPQINLFMGDTTFTPGGIVTPDSHLLAAISDNSGVNMSGYGIGNSLIAVLDDDKTFLLNEYYSANVDDPTSGWLDFPIKNLTPGRHSITVKAWDIYNNSAESVITFVVTDGEQVVIESFGNYPNPFVDRSTLFFTHNRSGDDLQAQLFIQKMTGEIVGEREVTINSSNHRVDILEINTGPSGEKKLTPGLYLARVIVRSLTNGSKNERVTKLIILN